MRIEGEGERFFYEGDETCTQMCIIVYIYIYIRFVGWKVNLNWGINNESTWGGEERGKKQKKKRIRSNRYRWLEFFRRAPSREHDMHY